MGELEWYKYTGKSFLVYLSTSPASTSDEYGETRFPDLGHS